ncbi:DNA-binding protein [Novosphingobium naphthalenivorans]|uniref:DNA-binding protein n=1 Tax=Novosphingobium naphthalenivorans TaxID=273168 RepID=UPI00082C83C9|nr:DNA-binding protein [Novosphingobium naphthalenivorans]
MVIEDDSQFGAVVAAARKALRLTQRDLALAINSGERFIVDLEAGKPAAKLGRALAAANSAELRLAAAGNSQA